MDKNNEKGIEQKDAEMQEVEIKADQNQAATVVPNDVLKSEADLSLARFATQIALLCKGDTGSKKRQRGIEVLEKTQNTLAKNIYYLLNHQIGKKGIRSIEDQKKHGIHLDNYIKGAKHALKTEAEFAKTLFSILNEERDKICALIDSYNLPETSAPEESKSAKLDIENFQSNNICDLLKYFESPEHLAGEITDRFQGYLAEQAELLKKHMMSADARGNLILNQNEDINVKDLEYAEKALELFSKVTAEVIQPRILSSLKNKKYCSIYAIGAVFTNEVIETLGKSIIQDIPADHFMNSVATDPITLENLELIDQFIQSIGESMKPWKMKDLFSYTLKKIPYGKEFFIPHKIDWQKRYETARTSKSPINLEGYTGQDYSTLSPKELLIVRTYQGLWTSKHKTEEIRQQVMLNCCTRVNQERNGGIAFRSIEMFDQYFQLEEPEKVGTSTKKSPISLKARDGVDSLSAAKDIRQKINFLVHEQLSKLTDDLKASGVIGEMEQMNMVDVNYILHFLHTFEYIHDELLDKISSKLTEEKAMTLSDLAERFEVIKNFPKTGLRPSNETKKAVTDFANYLKAQIANIDYESFLLLPSDDKLGESDWGIEMLMPKTVSWKYIRGEALQQGVEPDFTSLHFDISHLSKGEEQFIRKFKRKNKEKWINKKYNAYIINKITAREVNRKFRGGLSIRLADDVASVIDEDILPPAQKSPIEEMLEWVASIDTSSHKQWIEAFVGVLKNPKAKEIDIQSALSALGYLRSIYTKTKGNIQKHRFNIEQDKEGLIKALMPSTVMEGLPADQAGAEGITIEKLEETTENLEKTIAEQRENLEKELKELPELPRSEKKRDKQILDINQEIGQKKGKMLVLKAKSQLIEQACSRESDKEKKQKMNEEITNYKNQITAIEVEISKLEEQCNKLLSSLLNRDDLQKQIEKTSTDQADIAKIKEQIDNFRENIIKRILGLAEIYLS